MRLLTLLKPAFWDEADGASGPFKPGFNFRRMWRTAVILTSGVALAPLIFMTLVDYQVSQKAIEADITYQTARLVSNTRRSVASFLSEREAALNFIDKDNSVAALGDPLRLTMLLDHLEKSFGGFTDLGVIDENGLQHTYVGPYNLAGVDYSGQEWFRDLIDTGVHVSEVFLGFRQKPHLVVSVKHPLPSGGFYVLRATIDMQQFIDRLAEVEVGGRGDLFLVTRGGVLQTPSRLFGPALGRLPMAVPAFSEKTQVLETVVDGEALVVGYAYIQKTPFVLMAVKQKSALMRPWSETRKKLIAFLVLSVAAILVVILGVSTTLVNQIFEADLKRVKALHQVEYANKMASLGRLSAGVAHEINNPLAIINEKAGLIKDLFTLRGDYAADPKLMGLIDAIIASVDRCAAITRRLLNFARRSDAPPRPLDLGEVAREVLGFIGKEAEHRAIEVVVDIAPDVPRIECDRGRLQEIFLNLINNALAALADGGRLAISARRESAAEVRITVTDTGCGIPASDLPRIFEPFFSTKTGSGGTGLGLSITYGLVQELGGRIRVASELGRGTQFTLYLPVKAKPQGAPPHESSSG